jgi:hypothetical protein
MLNLNGNPIDDFRTNNLVQILPTNIIYDFEIIDSSDT